DQAGAFAEGNVDFRKVAAKHRLALPHFNISLARHARAQARQSKFVTTGREPVADPVGALPRRIRSQNDSRQFMTKEGNVVKTQMRSGCECYLPIGNRSEERRVGIEWTRGC